ncbi:rRNA-processing protein las1 [Scheffersomyces spartinae]|uniref:rRNA-processing protein las1 n=1 Tax=Scheffersomyces spartinae TaxID=45513 RepID=A0A9P7V8H0_9ASCO|nr:rRNA-processing protein las1 [Scheffersomyces spartinae]KAG7193113.1 rRNA-processing protein las1 [Scheffersomyces spartinae]
MPPIVEAYRSVEDLIQLRQWFYEPKTPEQRHRAVLRVNALASRATKLPHGVTMTSLLTSLQLKDKDLDSLESESTMQLAYTAALIRFVNGLLDPFQKSVHAAPLYRLAHQINLPGFFVELRHWGTHEQMALLNLLRDSCLQALNWLKLHYWDLLDLPDVPATNENEDEEEGITKFVKTNLVSYKRIRKSNLSMIYKFGDGSETGVKYWKAIKNLKLVSPLLLIRTMISSDFLIYNSPEKLSQGKGVKFNPLLIKLYRPLLDELGIEFKYQLLNLIFDMAEGSVSAIEWNQLLEWTAYLTSDITEYPDQDIKGIILDDVVGEAKGQDIKRIFIEQLVLPEVRSDPKYLKWLNSLKGFFKGSKLKLLVVNEITNENSKTLAQFSLPPSLDDIITSASEIDDLEKVEDVGAQPRKKQKLRPMFLFEPIPDWKPTPMGII